jgi:periodic tryptophan protein 2
MQIVIAGGYDPYNIYCWNLKTGNLIDVITGHEGPVTCLCYSPVEDKFVSGSWDRTVRVNNVLGKKARTESLPHSDKILDVKFRPDGKELCVSTFRGELYFWDIEGE